MIDTKPIPVVGYKRSDFLRSAAYGYCASRNLYYFGYKLVMLTTVEGLPVIYDLVPANTEERQAAEAILDGVTQSAIIGDKGFVGLEWQTGIQQQTGNTFHTPKRKNQLHPYPRHFERWLNAIHERIEGVFHELQNTGRNLERLLAKTVAGLVTRIIAKVTAHLLYPLNNPGQEISEQVN